MVLEGVPKKEIPKRLWICIKDLKDKFEIQKIVLSIEPSYSVKFQNLIREQNLFFI